MPAAAPSPSDGGEPGPKAWSSRAAVAISADTPEITTNDLVPGSGTVGTTRTRPRVPSAASDTAMSALPASSRSEAVAIPVATRATARTKHVAAPRDTLLIHAGPV